MIRINLLPGAARKRSAGANVDVGALLAGLMPKVDKFALGAGAAVAVSVAAIGLMFFTQHGRAQQLTERESVAVQDSARFAVVMNDRMQAEASRDAILRQLAIIQSIDDRRYLWSHVLEEVSAALPPFTWLTQIVQTSAPPTAAQADTAPARGGRNARQAPAKAPETKSVAARTRELEERRNAVIAAVRAPMRFRIVGNTVDIQALTRFMRDLEASPFIQNVQLARSDLVMVDQKEVTEFQLDAQTERPDSTMILVEPLSVELR